MSRAGAGTPLTDYQAWEILKPRLCRFVSFVVKLQSPRTGIFRV
jgi:hypothetical protein